MRLRVVALAYLAVRVRARGVKISEHRKLQPVCRGIILENALHHELCGSVRVYGRLRHILRNRHSFGLAVGSAGRRKYDPAAASAAHYPQKVQRICYIVEIILFGVGNALSHIRKRGKMHHSLYGIVAVRRVKRGLYVFNILKVSQNKAAPFDRFPVTVHQIVEYDRFISAPVKLFVCMRAYITCAAADKNRHYLSSRAACRVFLRHTCFYKRRHPAAAQRLSPFAFRPLPILRPR